MFVAMAFVLLLPVIAAYAAYAPAPDEVAALTAKAQKSGKHYNGRWVVAVGQTYQAGNAAYFYHYDNGKVLWRLEEWSMELDADNYAVYRVVAWNFWPDYAEVSEYIIKRMSLYGKVEIVRSFKPMDIASSEVVSKSELARKMILGARENEGAFFTN
jgi:hypothetical protein